MKRMFKSATFLLRLLKAFDASTIKTASHDSSSKIAVMAWTAASAPASWPAHSFRGPAAFRTSAFVTAITAMPTIRRTTSQIPIGRTPGFLSKGINRQARKASKPCGSTESVQRRRAHLANAEQRSLECRWKPVQIRRQPAASMPDGPAEPCVLSAAARMDCPVSC